MTRQKQHFPSFATTVSALGILLYCIGFSRVELELNNQKKRLNALENKPETKPPSSDSNIVKIIKDARGMYKVCSSRSTQPLNIVYNFINSERSLTILKKKHSTMINLAYLNYLLITTHSRLSVPALVAQAHYQSAEQHYVPYSLFYYSCSINDSVLKRNFV